MREVAAYERLQDLQWLCIPHLLAYGNTDTRWGTAFYVATEWVEVVCRPSAHMLRLCVQQHHDTS